MPINANDMVRFLPEIILTVVATLLMVLEPLIGSPPRRFFGHLSIAALVAGIAASVNVSHYPGVAFGGMLVMDGFAVFFRVLVLGVGILVVLASYRYLRREGAGAGEYHALLLYSIVGQCLMAAGNELIVIFIGLEISSIASYVLAGYLRDDKRANEAALKYFLLGSFATAFFLYGVAIVYGVTGTTNLMAIRGAVLGGAASPAFLAVAAALMFVGLGFKVAGAPFHSWAPDVYQGAPSPVTAFLSTGPKAAAFAIFLRIFLTPFQPIGRGWEPLVWMCALASMTVGNFAALLQTNVKRMLGYSSVAHAGYVLVALAARSNTGTAAAMFYLAAYALMNIGAFAVVLHLAGKGERYQEIADFKGLAAKQPFVAAMFSIFLFSLIGVPMTAGFFGKFYVFKAALESNLVWLTVLGMINSAVAAFYYLRLLVMMYMHKPGEAAALAEEPAAGLKGALALAAAGTLLLGVFPSLALDVARRASAIVK